MSVVEDTRVGASDAETLTPDTDHFICCDECTDEMIGQPTRSLCGLVDSFTGEFVDAVACVVCNDLSDSDWCPKHGTCPYA